MVSQATHAEHAAERRPHDTVISYDPNFSSGKSLAFFVIACISTGAGLLFNAQEDQYVEAFAPFVATFVAALLVPTRFAYLGVVAMVSLAVWSIYGLRDHHMAMFYVSFELVAAIKALAMIHEPSLRGNLGVRCIALVTVCILFQTRALPRSVTLGQEAVRGLRMIVVSAAAMLFVHRASLLVFPREFLQDSVFISGALMGFLATFGLHALDGFYQCVFLVPFRVRFHGLIQRFPLAATTLQSFWSERWNVSISLAFRYGVFQPVRKLTHSPVLAGFTVFLVSGLLHVSQFIAWKSSAHDQLMVFAFFITQWFLIVVEKLIEVNRWHRWVQRLWTLGWLFVTAPLITIPLVHVHKPWH